jgi:hypothetical protein
VFSIGMKNSKMLAYSAGVWPVLRSARKNCGVLSVTKIFRQRTTGARLITKDRLDQTMIKPRLTPIVTASVLDVACSFEMIELT